MKRLMVLSLLLSVALWSCSDNEATLVNTGDNSNNSNNTNNENNENNQNNQNNENNENNENNGNNDPMIINNRDIEIYDNEPGDDNRDYVGELPPKPSGEVEEFVYDMVETFCTRALLECRDQARVWGALRNRSIATVGECVERYFTLNPEGAISDAISNGRADADPTAFQGCLDAISSDGSCSRIASAFDAPRSLFPECQDALNGQRGSQETCGATYDCGLETRCDRRLADTCVGRCVSVVPVRVSCGQELCELSEFCGFDGDGDRTCMAFQDEGDDCNSELVCGENLFCLAGTCRPHKFGFQEGEECNDRSNLCAPGLMCEYESLADPAGLCVERGGQGDSCNSEESCRWNMTCDDATCAPKVDSGACGFAVECLTENCRADSTCFPTGMVCDVQ